MADDERLRKTDSKLLCLQQEVIDMVYLPVLIPVMNGEGLLTDDQDSYLRNDLHTPQARLSSLPLTINGKGVAGLGRFYRCLRVATAKHARHGELANLMLQRWPWLAEFEPSSFNPQVSSFGPSCYPSSQTATLPHYQGASLPHSLSMQDVALPHHPPQTATYPHHSPAQAETLPHHVPSQTATLPHHPPQTVTFPHHPPSWNVTSESRPLAEHQVKGAYDQLIRIICSHLMERGVTVEQFSSALKYSLYPCVSSLTTNLPHFSSLLSIFEFLQEKGLCHATDVDLLLHILRESLQEMDLYEEVLAYWRRIEHLPIACQHFQFMQATLISTDYLHMMTVHPSQTLTLRDVRRMKEFLADSFNILRHLFWFTGYQPGSVVLVWQFFESSWDKLQCHLEDVSKMALFEPKIASVCIRKDSKVLLRINVSGGLPAVKTLSHDDDDSEVTSSSSLGHTSPQVHTGQSLLQLNQFYLVHCVIFDYRKEEREVS